jgi:hypothetical protein
MVTGRASVLLPINELFQGSLLLGAAGQDQLHTVQRSRLRQRALIEGSTGKRVGVAFEDDWIAVVHWGHNPRCGTLGDNRRAKSQAEKQRDDETGPVQH